MVHLTMETSLENQWFQVKDNSMSDSTLSEGFKVVI